MENNNEPIRNPILSQNLGDSSNANQPEPENNTNNSVLPGVGGENNSSSTLPGVRGSQELENSTLPGVSTNESNGTLPGVGDINSTPNEPLPEMQNLRQDSKQNKGQSVFLDQQGFDQLNYGDQSEYNKENIGPTIPNTPPESSFGPEQNAQQDMNSNPYMQNNTGYQNANLMNQNYQDMNNPYMQNAGYQDMNSMNQAYPDQNIQQGYGMPQDQYSNMQNMQGGESQPMYGMDQNATNQAGSNASYNQPSYNNQETGNTDYNLEFVKNWMGSIYEKAHSKKFNWCAALFGEAYLLFRKQYLTGCLLLVLTSLITIIASITASPVFYAVVGVYELVKFFGLGFGFYPMYRSEVRKQLNKYKTIYQDNSQLMDAAIKNGGTSIIGLVIYIVVAVVVSIASATLTMNKINPKSKPATNTTNVTQEPQTAELEANFEEGYTLTYDSNKWFTDDNKSFVDENYTLTYSQMYTGDQLGLDFSTEEGRTTILTMLDNSFTAQATQAGLTKEELAPNTTFIAKDDEYYAYIDISSDSSINRYYFSILPDKNVMFQFVLAINDVKIDNTVNIDVINMITSIKEATAEDETENVLENAALTVGNETLNEVESEGGISNSVQSTLSNDNENVQATGNTANSRNSVRETTPTSANTVSSSNSTTSTSTGSLSSMVQQ